MTKVSGVRGGSAQVNPAQLAAQRRQAEKQKKADGTRTQNYIVIVLFCIIMVVMVIYTVANPKKNFAETPAIDESAILVHNGANYRYKQGTNAFFEDKMISELKPLFDVSLSDTTNLPACKSNDEEEKKKVEVPDSYDWRKANPGCVQQDAELPRDCSASHITSTLSAMSDHICQGSGKNFTVALSTQEVLDCPKGSRFCKGGSVNHVLSWGKRKGFIAKDCYAEKDTQDETCPEDHILENECRQQNAVYKVVDFCLAQEIDGVKREILKNGPVVGQMQVATDFLTYKEGIYHRTQESFKFQGNHIMKIVGWETGDEEGGQSFWIVQNVWGEDWGEEGFVKVAIGESMLDSFAIGFAAYPMSMAEYYAQQQPQVTETPQEQDFKIEMPDEEAEKIDLDQGDAGEIENLNMDNEEEADVLDEAVEL